MAISRKTSTIIAGVAVVAGLSVGGVAIIVPLVASPADDGVRSEQPAAQPEVTTAPSVGASTQVNSAEFDAMLLYMIEEEKLAHDVYVVLDELWGERVFERIASSEITHEERVLELLSTNDLTDLRTGVSGTFVNEELQTLYDDLVALGTESRQSAIEVGIAIETRDIADLATSLALTEEADARQVLQSLLSASENHLAAFTRQLG
jgi:hypothetical protein